MGPHTETGAGPESALWFIDVNGRKTGPFGFEEMSGLYREGEIPKGTQVTAEHLKGLWLSIEDALAPPTPSAAAAAPAAPSAATLRAFRPPARPEGLDPPIRAHTVRRGTGKAARAASTPPAPVAAPEAGPQAHPVMGATLSDAPTDPGPTGPTAEAAEAADEVQLIHELQAALAVAKRKNVAKPAPGREAMADGSTPLADWKSKLRELVRDRKVQVTAGVGLVALLLGIVIARWFMDPSATAEPRQASRPPRRTVINEPRPVDSAPPQEGAGNSGAPIPREQPTPVIQNPTVQPIPTNQPRPQGRTTVPPPRGRDPREVPNPFSASPPDTTADEDGAGEGEDLDDDGEGTDGFDDPAETPAPGGEVNHEGVPSED
ncbi:MAG: DUF4339 domain-containing protein [Bdellovibrionales bacterium]|nr:DUF4339 domain-containing protein [Bdellovibrionales bacterium]